MIWKHFSFYFCSRPIVPYHLACQGPSLGQCDKTQRGTNYCHPGCGADICVQVIVFQYHNDFVLLLNIKCKPKYLAWYKRRKPAWIFSKMGRILARQLQHKWLFKMLNWTCIMIFLLNYLFVLIFLNDKIHKKYLLKGNIFSPFYSHAEWVFIKLFINSTTTYLCGCWIKQHIERWQRSEIYSGVKDREKEARKNIKLCFFILLKYNALHSNTATA